jgi:predicted O-methyltransferase YrrM
MNADSFKDWFVNRFLNLLEEESIIILDNASYHSRVIDKLPSTNSRKQDIREWVHKNNISYQPYETKTELLQKVKQFRTQGKRYELDEIAVERGHQVIRLPPYHCQYNPI